MERGLLRTCIAAGPGALFISVWFASVGRSQQPVPVSRLEKPLAEFPEGFSSLNALRELPDGRVMVLERCESVVVLLDFAARRFTQVARTGAGPGEYVRAAALWALPGDSSAIYDRANLRFLVIDPTGKPGRFFRAPQSLATRVGGFAVEAPFTVRGTDGRGRFYARQAGRRATEKGIVQDDSVPVERWDPLSGRRDTVGFYRVLRGGLVKDFTEPPFSTVIEWAVSPAGDVALVYPHDYHVEFISPAGARKIGKPNPWTRVRLGKAHKERYRKEQQASVCASSTSKIGFVPNVEKGKVDVVELRGGEEPKEWPEHLPPFLRSAVSFSPDGMLWVHRTGEVGEAPTYDLIDSTGRVVRRILLQPGSKLLGFGKSRIFIARVDRDDLQYVQVFPSQALTASVPRSP